MDSYVIPHHVQVVTSRNLIAFDYAYLNVQQLTPVLDPLPASAFHIDALRRRLTSEDIWCDYQGRYRVKPEFGDYLDHTIELPGQWLMVASHPYISLEIDEVGVFPNDVPDAMMEAIDLPHLRNLPGFITGRWKHLLHHREAFFDVDDLRRAWADALEFGWAMRVLYQIVKARSQHFPNNLWHFPPDPLGLIPLVPGPRHALTPETPRMVRGVRRGVPHPRSPGQAEADAQEHPSKRVRPLDPPPSRSSITRRSITRRQHPPVRKQLPTIFPLLRTRVTGPIPYMTNGPHLIQRRKITLGLQTRPHGRQTLRNPLPRPRRGPSQLRLPVLTRPHIPRHSATTLSLL